MEDLLSHAISNKIEIGFFYHNEHRIVEPHAFGYDKNGRLKLRGYQISGGSESGDSRGWKLFAVEDILSLQLLPATFGNPRSGYNPSSDAQILQIINKL